MLLDLLTCVITTTHLKKEVRVFFRWTYHELKSIHLKRFKNDERACNTIKSPYNTQTIKKLPLQSIGQWHKLWLAKFFVKKEERLQYKRRQQRR